MLNRHGDFLRAGVENTALNKSFKLILLLALLELDGLREPPTLAALASHTSWANEAITSSRWGSSGLSLSSLACSRSCRNALMAAR